MVLLCFVGLKMNVWNRVVLNMLVIWTQQFHLKPNVFWESGEFTRETRAASLKRTSLGKKRGGNYHMTTIDSFLPPAPGLVVLVVWFKELPPFNQNLVALLMRIYANPSYLAWQWPRCTLVICPSISDKNLWTNSNNFLNHLFKGYLCTATEFFHVKNWTVPSQVTA